MRTSFSAATEAHPNELFDVVRDLGGYPHWLDIVSEVEPADRADTWRVTLKARVGPFSRSKRLRMVRVIDDLSTGDRPSVVRFERVELDGRRHSDWTLAAEVGPTDTPAMRSEVRIDLTYEGSLWSALLDGVLGSAAERATSNLQAYVKS